MSVTVTAASATATAAAVVALAPGVSAAPLTPTPPQIQYAYTFNTAPGDTVVSNLQPLTGTGYDLHLSATYGAGVPGLPASAGGGTTAVLFSGTGAPGYAGGAGSRGSTTAAPGNVYASSAVSVGVVFATALPIPIPATLRDSPNVMQSGMYKSTGQVKVQVGKDKRANCRFKGSVNGARGANPAPFSRSASPVVADNAWHTVVCTKGPDTARGTKLTLTVDGVSFSGTVATVGTLDLTGNLLQVATNSPTNAETSDQFFGTLDGLVWAVAGSDTDSMSAVSSYVPGLLTP